MINLGTTRLTRLSRFRFARFIHKTKQCVKCIKMYRHFTDKKRITGGTRQTHTSVISKIWISISCLHRQYNRRSLYLLCVKSFAHQNRRKYLKETCSSCFWHYWIFKKCTWLILIKCNECTYGRVWNLGTTEGLFKSCDFRHAIVCWHCQAHLQWRNIMLFKM